MSNNDQRILNGEVFKYCGYIPLPPSKGNTFYCVFACSTYKSDKFYLLIYSIEKVHKRGWWVDKIDKTSP